MKHTIIVLGVLLILAGCSKLTQENYDKLEMGMSQAEVEDVLGSAERCSRSLGTQSCMWGDEEDKHIKVMFMNNKAVTFSYEGI